MIEPLRDNVLIKQDEAEKKSNIVSPDEYNPDKPGRGTVVAIGSTLKSLVPKKGDKVLFVKFTANPVNGEDDLVLVKEEDILAIVKKGDKDDKNN